jgi:hypothetical protein
VKKLGLVLITVLVLLSVPAWPQEKSEFPKMEFFGGYSLRSLDYDGSNVNRLNMHGFQANGTYNFHKNVGVTGDFGIQFASANANTHHDYELLIGPQFSLRRNRITVFAHQFIGGESFDGGSQLFFALGTGGGLDVNLDNRIGLRVIQFDWIPSSFAKHEGEGWFKNNIRFGFGITFKP